MHLTFPKRNFLKKYVQVINTTYFKIDNRDKIKLAPKRGLEWNKEISIIMQRGNICMIDIWERE